MTTQDPFGFAKAIQVPKDKKAIDKVHKLLFKKKVGRFVLGDKKYFVREQKGNRTKYTYPFNSTEEAEEYFLGKDPRKNKDYKRLLGK